MRINTNATPAQKQAAAAKWAAMMQAARNAPPSPNALTHAQRGAVRNPRTGNWEYPSTPAPYDANPGVAAAADAKRLIDAMSPAERADALRRIASNSGTAPPRNNSDWPSDFGPGSPAPTYRPPAANTNYYPTGRGQDYLNQQRPPATTTRTAADWPNDVVRLSPGTMRDSIYGTPDPNSPGQSHGGPAYTGPQYGQPTPNPNYNPSRPIGVGNSPTISQPTSTYRPPTTSNPNNYQTPGMFDAYNQQRSTPPTMTAQSNFNLPDPYGINSNPAGPTGAANPAPLYDSNGNWITGKPASNTPAGTAAGPAPGYDRIYGGAAGSGYKDVLSQTGGGQTYYAPSAMGNTPTPSTPTPPNRQTRDIVNLPGGGQGSSTMANWLNNNMGTQPTPQRWPEPNQPNPRDQYPQPTQNSSVQSSLSYQGFLDELSPERRTQVLAENAFRDANKRVYTPADYARMRDEGAAREAERQAEAERRQAQPIPGSWADQMQQRTAIRYPTTTPAGQINASSPADQRQQNITNSQATRTLGGGYGGDNGRHMNDFNKAVQNNPIPPSTSGMLGRPVPQGQTDTQFYNRDNYQPLTYGPRQTAETGWVPSPQPQPSQFGFDYGPPPQMSDRVSRLAGAGAPKTVPAWMNAGPKR